MQEKGAARIHFIPITCTHHENYHPAHGTVFFDIRFLFTTYALSTASSFSKNQPWSLPVARFSGVHAPTTVGGIRSAVDPINMQTIVVSTN